MSDLKRDCKSLIVGRKIYNKKATAEISDNFCLFVGKFVKSVSKFKKDIGLPSTLSYYSSCPVSRYPDIKASKSKIQYPDTRYKD